MSCRPRNSNRLIEPWESSRRLEETMRHTDRLYTVEQAAGKLHLSRYTIRQWIHEGRLLAHKVGRGWRIRAADLQRFLQPPEPPTPDHAVELGNLLVADINRYLEEHEDCTLDAVSEMLTSLQEYVERSQPSD